MFTIQNSGPQPSWLKSIRDGTLCGVRPRALVATTPSGRTLHFRAWHGDRAGAIEFLATLHSLPGNTVVMVEANCFVWDAGGRRLKTLRSVPFSAEIEKLFQEERARQTSRNKRLIKRVHWRPGRTVGTLRK